MVDWVRKKRGKEEGGKGDRGMEGRGKDILRERGIKVGVNS
jgi:hypothetical protein